MVRNVLYGVVAGAVIGAIAASFLAYLEPEVFVPASALISMCR